MNTNFDIIWETLPLPMRIIDENSIIVNVNQAFCKFFNKTKEELVGKSLSILYTPDIEEIKNPDFRKKEYLDFKKNLQSGNIRLHQEVELHLWDGRRLWMEIVNSIIYDNNKKPYVHSIFRDITERVRKEKIQNALYQISELTNLKPEMNEFYTRVHHIVRELMPADNFYIALYDENKDEVSFPYFVDEIDEPPEPSKMGKGLTAYIIRKGLPLLVTEEIEKELVEKGEIEIIGSPAKIWLGVPLILNNKSIGAIVVQDYHTDKRYGEEEKQILTFVSEQITITLNHLRIQESLVHSETQFRQVWMNSFDGMRIVDKNGIIVDVNPAFCKMFDVEAKDVIGKRYTVIYKDADIKFRKFIENFKNRNINPHLEQKVVLWNDKEIYLELSNSYITLHDNNEYLFSIFRDMTQKKNMELELIESAKKLRELNATKDIFFSIISHDLKSPFNSILGFSNVLSTDFDSLPKEQIKHFINIIYKTGKSIYSLLENLLQWSRLQTGRISNQPIILNLYEQVNNVIVLLSGNALRKNIRLENLIPLRTNVFVDQNFISAILQNLISNAIKFTPQNGSITISCKDLGDLVEISVKDTGVGMDEAAVSNLIKLDCIRSTAGTDKETGTGLGLLLCKQMIEASGGTIRVESKVNSGSNFIFTLPKAKN